MRLRIRLPLNEKGLIDNMKRVLCILITSFMLFSTVFAAQFNDTHNHWAQTEVDRWSDMGIINGDGENFHPDQNITRGEFAVIIDRIMNYQTAEENTFTDLDNDFYTLPLLRLNRAKVIMGYENRIRPMDSISRQEAVVILSRALFIDGEDGFNEPFKDVDLVEEWALPYMTAMVNKGYINGAYGMLNPESSITRAETVKLLDNILGRVYSDEEYQGVHRAGLTVINSDNAVVEDCIFDGNVIVTNGASVHFANSKINGTLIAQSPEKSSVKLENTPFEKLNAKNEYTVEIIATEITEEEIQEEQSAQENPVTIPEEEVPEEEIYDEGYDEGYGGDVEVPVESDDSTGEIVFCIEAFTIGGGYIIAPVKVSLYEGASVAYILDQLLAENGIEYTNSGSLDSGFYLSHINGLTDFTFEIPDVIREKLIQHNYQITEQPYAENTLGEFDFTQGSGWMYCVNNEFPDVGMSDYYLNDGDVVRIVFTTAYGSDVGGNNFAEYDRANDFFEQVNRDSLTRVIAEQGIDSFADFIDIISNPAATQEELDSIY